MKRQIITIVSLLLNVAVHPRRDWRTSGVSFTQIAPLLACHSKKINRDISTNLKMYHLFLQRTVLTGSKQKYTCASVMCFGGLCISDVLWGGLDGGVTLPMRTKLQESSHKIVEILE